MCNFYNFGRPVLEESSFRDVPICSSGCHFVQLNNLAECLVRNIFFVTV